MSSTDRWLEVIDGKIILKTENDGWRFLRRGPETTEDEIDLETVRRFYPHFYERISRQLAAARSSLMIIVELITALTWSYGPVLSCQGISIGYTKNESALQLDNGSL